MMARLLLAEWKRFWVRRITRFFPAIVAVLMVGGIVIAFYVINGDDANTPDFLNDVAGGVEGRDALGPVASLLPVMAFVIGASFIGADLRTGMLGQILTWEPRRPRLLFARMLTAGLGVALLAMVLAAFLIALLYGLMGLVGTVDGTTSELWGNLFVAILRTGATAALFCAFGIAITLIVDSSVGSIVGFLIYWFIIENFLVSAFLPKVAVYLPITNGSSFSSGADVERIEGSVFSDFEIVEQHSYLIAGLILALWIGVAVAAAAVTFVRRDME